MPWAGPPPSAPLKRARAEVPRLAERELRRTTDDVRDALAEASPVDSGELARSWRRGGGGLRRTVTNTAPHAPYVALDTADAEAALAAGADRLATAIDQRLDPED